MLTDPSSLAWAFNIRGSDVPHTPLALGFAVLAADGKHRVYIDKRKLPMTTEAYMTQLCDLRPPSALEADLAELARSGARIALDPALAAERLRMLVADNGGTVVTAADPARLPRATKNAAELAGARAAHRRDGAAVAKMLCWLDAQTPGSIDEIATVTALEEFRRKTGEETQMPLRDVSFSTISGSGPNGAIMHYRVSRATNRVLADGELFLLDSGAQYQDGTTDITRTVPVGKPSEEMRERYTLVLKGMIQISMLRFPAGTRGSEIDAVARMALWQRGLDFAHGTGHGVGSYLSVHEGPQRIARTGTEKFLEGMILSNEPGYYKDGALRHPAREPDRGDAGRDAGGRRHRHARFRDADAGALRHAHAAGRAPDPRRAALARQPITPGCLPRSGRCWTARRWPGWRRRRRRCRKLAH